MSERYCFTVLICNFISVEVDIKTRTRDQRNHLFPLNKNITHVNNIDGTGWSSKSHEIVKIKIHFFASLRTAETHKNSVLIIRSLNLPHSLLSNVHIESLLVYRANIRVVNL